MPENRGRAIAKLVAEIINGMPDPVYPFTARYSRFPKIKKTDLGEIADVTVAPLTLVGDDQDQGSERLNYGITVGVTAGLEAETGPNGEVIPPAESSIADRVEDLVEQIQNYLSHDDRLFQRINGYFVELELPFVNNPVYSLELLREAGIFQSITIFNYLTEVNRHG